MNYVRDHGDASKAVVDSRTERNKNPEGMNDGQERHQRDDALA
jgi:hypothetical protein